MKVNMEASVPIKMWTEGVPVERKAEQQLINTANVSKDKKTIHKENE